MTVRDVVPSMVAVHGDNYLRIRPRRHRTASSSSSSSSTKSLSSSPKSSTKTATSSTTLSGTRSTTNLTTTSGTSHTSAGRLRTKKQARRLVALTRKSLEQRTRLLPWLLQQQQQDKKQAIIPRLHPRQIQPGKVLGVGGFGLVRDVSIVGNNLVGQDPASSRRMVLKTLKTPNYQHPQHNQSPRRIDGGEQQHPKHDDHHVLCLDDHHEDHHTNPNTTNTNTTMVSSELLLGCHQLELERRTLERLDHPHIIRLRGYSGLETIAETQRLDSCFLLLDYLPEMLSDRIASWQAAGSTCKNNQKHNKTKKRSSRLVVPFSCSSNNNNKKNSCAAWNDDKTLVREQLQAAIAIASALQYLHQQRIILLDLKPDNIGFDADNNLKLFEFGLVAHNVVVHPSKDQDDPAPHSDDDDMPAPQYHGGRVGTPRYMAPEVAREGAYNHKADVYSFSLVLWQMLMGIKPPTDPPVPTGWPTALRRILERGWSPNVDERPFMTEYQFVLEDLVRRYCPPA